MIHSSVAKPGAPGGFAIEMALKAFIMKRHGWNDWPSKEMAKNLGLDLHIHSITRLIKATGLDGNLARPQVKASLAVAMQWDRGHDYVADTMPLAIARSMFDAAFGENGVVEWLKTQS